MKHLKIVLASVVGASLLAACTAIDIDKTRGLSSKGTAFQKALHVEYAEIAFGEDDEGDPKNAVFFDKKAQAAAQGKGVQPQAIKARNLPKNKVGELAAARTRLLAALDSGAREKAPKHAARAQVMFDCWIEEQEEDFQPKDIARCRSAFEEALAAAEQALVPAPMAAKPAPKKKAVPPPPPPRDYVVYFDTDSSEIDAAAEAVIKQAVADVKSRKKAKVAVVGHTDTVGKNDYNKTLSDKRADAVVIRLVRMGVSGKKLKKDRFGETSPAVATGDDKDERKNRRVNIRISN